MKLYLLIFPLFLSISSSISLEAQERSAYWQQRVSLFDILGLEDGDIVFLGNSITDGGEFNELLKNSKVKNRGINSDVVEGVKDRLYQILPFNPSKIFLLIGINDISHDKTADQIAEEYESLVNEIHDKAPHSRLYIQSVMPINNNFGKYKKLTGKESVILELNENLKQIALKYKDIYIDLTPSLTDQNGNLDEEFTNDGLHLLGKGYLKWMEAISPFLEN